jgi:hypothetical protein
MTKGTKVCPRNARVRVSHRYVFALNHNSEMEGHRELSDAIN